MGQACSPSASGSRTSLANGSAAPIRTVICASATRISPARRPKRREDCLPRFCLGRSGAPTPSEQAATPHQLYGNRMWSARLSLAEVKEDAGWTRDMPGVYRALLSALTAPLRRRYLNRWNARAVAALVAGVTLTRRSTMPAKSAAQQKAAGAALTAKRGKTSPSKLRGASKSMYKSMSERQAR